MEISRINQDLKLFGKDSSKVKKGRDTLALARLLQLHQTAKIYRYPNIQVQNSYTVSDTLLPPIRNYLQITRFHIPHPKKKRVQRYDLHRTFSETASANMEWSLCNNTMKEAYSNVKQ